MRLYHVDAFTGSPFTGNPAAVCLLEHPKVSSWMQHVAGEMNLSETAFLIRQSDGYNLRWFSPEAEVDLCGHATLAAAYVLFETKAARNDAPIIFHTKSGLLPATLREEGWIELDFPAITESAAEPPENLLSGLDVEAEYVGKNQYDYVVEVESETALKALKPDFDVLRTVPARGVVVTSRCADTDSFDFVSRCFYPSLGVNEDPVTGSAHCCLGPYWGKKLSKMELTGYQASSRGGVVRLYLKDQRILLMGQAVMILAGELRV